MCRFCASAEHSKDMLCYKATLLQEILAVNLMNAQVYEHARRESQVDTLTGTATRRVFEAQLEREHRRSVRHGSPFSVALIDVDKFKQVNDRYGHEAGDSILRRLTEVFRQGIRTTDVLCRYGGDEFVLLMPETDAIHGRAVVDRLRGSAFSVTTEGGEPVTISCGVAEWNPADGESGTEVLRRADAALYESKRAGRNRVTVHGGTIEPAHV